MKKAMKYANIEEAITAIVNAGRATEEELCARIDYMKQCGFNEHVCLTVLSTWRLTPYPAEAMSYMVEEPAMLHKSLHNYLLNAATGIARDSLVFRGDDCVQVNAFQRRILRALAWLCGAPLVELYVGDLLDDEETEFDRLQSVISWGGFVSIYRLTNDPDNYGWYSPFAIIREAERYESFRLVACCGVEYDTHLLDCEELYFYKGELFEPYLRSTCPNAPEDAIQVCNRIVAEWPQAVTKTTIFVKVLQEAEKGIPLQIAFSRMYQGLDACERKERRELVDACINGIDYKSKLTAACPNASEDAIEVCVKFAHACEEAVKQEKLPNRGIGGYTFYYTEILKKVAAGSNLADAVDAILGDELTYRQYAQGVLPILDTIQK